MAKVSLECKRLMVKEIADRISEAEVFIITHYNGLTSQELDDMRRKIRHIAGDYMIVKNSMARNALKDARREALSEFIRGDVGIALHKSDPSIISKILVQFSKEHEALKIDSGMIRNTIVSAEDIIRFASLPPRGELLAMLVRALNAPVGRIASSLNGIILKLVLVLNAIKQKEEGGDKI